jgi:putative hydrolase
LTDQPDSEEFEEFLKKLFESGQIDPEQLSKMAGIGTNPIDLAKAFGQMQSMMSNSEDPVNWEMATNKALEAPQNVAEFMNDLETPKSEVLIYLAIRELAISGLYQSNRWLKDQITTQVREFAAGLKIDISSMEDLAQRIDPSDPQALNELIESGSFITPRSEEQDAALQRIEALLALIEGWADAVSFEAAKRLPAINAISELFMRRRATQGVSEKTFGILLGLKLRPRLVREATAMWQLVAQEFDGQKRDSLWQHPDQLPTLQDIQDPAQLISRLKGASDDIDSELRKLLGE